MSAKLLKMSQLSWEKLKSALKGELYVDDLHRSIYATDASVYRMKPLAVFFPKDASDISVFLKFLEGTSIGVIPRAVVFTAAKRDMSALRIVEEDSNIFAEVKRGQRSGWSYIYIGNPVTRRIDGKNFTFDGETNRFISISNMLECN